MEKKKSRQLDIYHRAFKELRKETADNEQCKKNRKIIRESNSINDRIETIRYKCTIETDWIEKIESTLPNLEAAVLEDRQFIRQEGDTVPIEKAKHVSRASVEHLAKHSNLITHIPEEGDKLIPDKLYVVENLSNYAIYENRFLYMVLNYTKDFVTMRYDAIEELWNSYSSELSMKKDIHLRHRHITYTVAMTEKSSNDSNTAYDREIMSLLERMNSIVHMISILLETPLMKEVAKVPMLKPPVTRTNMIRMDIHFRATMELYDYLVSYSGEGYKAERIRNIISPLSENIGDEFAELVMLNSYLVYAYGGGLKEEIDAEYEREERSRREKAEAETLRLIAEMKARIEAGGGDVDGYMLALERRNKELECDRSRLKKLRLEYDNLTEAHKELVKERDALNVRAEELSSRQNIILQQLNDAVNEVQRLRPAEEKGQTEELTQEGQAQPYELKLSEDSVFAGSTPMGHTSEINASAPEGYTTLNEENIDYKERYYIAQACCNALRKELGRISILEDFTSREAFVELEIERKYFNEFFNEEWKKTKKQIRKEHLWAKKNKGEVSESDSGEDEADS